ncbi:MAG: ribosome biogenesis GTP-binding protein YihA/YsxC [Thermodesulfobacteriota bacterium]
MKITSAEFSVCAVTTAQFPTDGLPEIALIGRSNVGKSSLINTLVNRKKLAKTSSTPGKTRTINFYLINRSFYLVDLPGFGYARVPMTVKRSWERMMERYMESREALAGAIVILDPRRDAGDMEGFVYDWVETLGIPVVTVFTKADKLSRNKLSSRTAKLKKALPLTAPVLFSSLTGKGKAELAGRIRAMVAERGRVVRPQGRTRPSGVEK